MNQPTVCPVSFCPEIWEHWPLDATMARYAYGNCIEKCHWAQGHALISSVFSIFFLVNHRRVNPDTLKMTPRCLLVGHTAPVLCLSRASIVQDNNFLVSSSENGEMCTWDLVDGKCKENVKLPQVHTSIQAYHMSNCDDIRLFCNGYYAEILVMDPFSLEILFSLSSKVKPDWISALHVSYKPMGLEDRVERSH